MAGVGMVVALACVRPGRNSLFRGLPGGPLFSGLQGHVGHGLLSGSLPVHRTQWH